MQNYSKIIYIFFVNFLITSASFANTTSLPELRGKGDYYWFMLHVYEATLWADKKAELYSSPLVLELKYQRNFDGKDIVKQSMKELDHLGAPASERARWESELLSIFPNVKKGDTIRARFHPEEGVYFYLNENKSLGKLSDVNFSKNFLDIWLSEKTRAPELRKKLLGDNS